MDQIEQPAFVPPAEALVRRDRTSIPDVYRHYDVAKAERVEATPETTNTPAQVA